MHFRNLRLTELPPSEPALDAKHVARTDEGFVSLYSGVDLSGWRVGEEQKGSWKARNWRLITDGVSGDLVSEKEFGDLMLICDWRWKDKAAPAEVSGGQRPDARVVVTGSLVESAAPAGRWNRVEITLRGSRRTVVVNGVTVATDEAMPGVPARGPIVLQAPGAPIQFANVYVRKLGP